MAKSSFSLFYMKVSFILRLLAKNQRMSLKQINQAWICNLHGDGREIGSKCFGKYRDAIAEIFGIEILKIPVQGGCVYTIENIDDLENNEIFIWSLNAFSMGELLLKAKSIHGRILTDKFPSGTQHLEMVIEAMFKNVVVTIVYQKYAHTISKEHTIEIYCMSQYRNRLYVTGKTEMGGICTFSLDRIVSIVLTDKKFDTPVDFEPHEYFKDTFGIYVDYDRFPPVRVGLRTYEDELYYMMDTPVHSSQKVVCRTKEYTDFEYYISLTSDFIGYLLSRGDRVQILYPQSLVDEVKRRLENAINRYNDHMKE